MCLISISRRPHVARKDIKVFKVVCPIKGQDYPYVSPIMCEPLYSGMNVTRKAYRIAQSYVRCYEITDGYIHAMRTMEGARKKQEEYIRLDMEVGDPIGSYSIIECTIPKGTRYYDGKDGDICSKRMILP